MLGFLKRFVLKREVRHLLERLSKEGHLNFVKALFGGSKKLTAILAGVVMVLFREGLGLDDQTAGELVKLLMTYVAAQGVVDVGLALSGAKKG